MSYNTGPKIVTDGLVLCLDAADKNSYPGTGSTWYDLSGNGYHGTINGATFSNNAFNFDGTDDYIDLSSHASSLMFDSPATINVFMRPTSNISVSNTILSLTNGISDINTDNLDRLNISYGSLTTTLTNETFGIYKAINQQTPNVQSTVNVDADINLGNTYQNKWVNYCVTVQSNAWQARLNGENLTLTGSSYWNGNIFGFGENISPQSKVAIGAFLTDTVGSVFNGQISMVAIYNKSLSANEVLQNYNPSKAAMAYR